jgi:hypothetical protein
MTLPPTHAYAAKTTTQIEPTYPCWDFQDGNLWNSGIDRVDDNSNMQRVPCERIPGQLCRSCGDDERVGRNITCATLAIYYQHTVIDFVRGDQEPAEASSGDYGDNAEDNDRVQDSNNVRHNGDVAHENEWCDQKRHRGSTQYSHGMTTCGKVEVAKEKES